MLNNSWHAKDDSPFSFRKCFGRMMAMLDRALCAMSSMNFCLLSVW